MATAYRVVVRDREAVGGITEYVPFFPRWATEEANGGTVTGPAPATVTDPFYCSPNRFTLCGAIALAHIRRAGVVIVEYDPADVLDERTVTNPAGVVQTELRIGHYIPGPPPRGSGLPQDPLDLVELYIAGGDITDEYTEQEITQGALYQLPGDPFAP